MTEGHIPLITEDVVEGEIVKLRSLYTRRGLDNELSKKTTQIAVAEFFPQLQELSTTAGAGEIVVDFKEGIVGRRTEKDVTGADGFLWSIATSQNLGANDSSIPGFEQATLFKYSPTLLDRNAPAPITYRSVTVTRSGFESPPFIEIEHAYFAHPRGKKPFTHIAINTHQSIQQARALLYEFKTAPTRYVAQSA